uniref:arginine/serine-rich protein 1-like n=1 Tax=Myxine glutinosa TaxID=7769 RepID=UPI00358ED46A
IGKTSITSKDHDSKRRSRSHDRAQDRDQKKEKTECSRDRKRSSRSRSRKRSQSRKRASRSRSRKRASRSRSRKRASRSRSRKRASRSRSRKRARKSRSRSRDKKVSRFGGSKVRSPSRDRGRLRSVSRPRGRDRDKGRSRSRSREHKFAGNFNRARQSAWSRSRSRERAPRHWWGPRGCRSSPAFPRGRLASPLPSPASRGGATSPFRITKEEKAQLLVIARANAAVVNPKVAVGVMNSIGPAAALLPLLLKQQQEQVTAQLPGALPSGPIPLSALPLAIAVSSQTAAPCQDLAVPSDGPGATGRFRGAAPDFGKLRAAVVAANKGHAQHTIQELTQKCQEIADSLDDDVPTNRPVNSDEEEEEEEEEYDGSGAPIHHPFKVRKPGTFSNLDM